MNNNRITEESILAEILSVTYQINGKLTVAFVTMKNGFQGLGQSACVDPANFDAVLGQKYALEDFITKIWPMMGYALQDRNFRAASAAPVAPAWANDPLFDGFAPFESKPITRMAMMIDDTNRVVQMGDKEYSYAGVRFVAHQQPVAGDYVVRLTADDTYHVGRAVFLERNIVPGVSA